MPSCARAIARCCRSRTAFASSHPGKQPYQTVEVAYGLQVLWPDHCVQGTAGAEFREDLQTPHAALVIRKGFRRAIDIAFAHALDSMAVDLLKTCQSN